MNRRDHKEKNIFSGIIFDLDGTLVDTYPGIQEALNETLRQLGRPPVDLPTIKRMVGRGVDILILNAVGAEQQEIGVELFKASYNKTHLSGSSILPGVPETLSYLKAHRIKMSVASNKPSNYSFDILRYLKIEHYFIDCYGPDRGVPPKPNPAMLTALMNTMETTTADTLYAGDMTIDSEVARNARLKVALIATGGHSKEELQAVMPDYLLTQFSELERIIA